MNTVASTTAPTTPAQKPAQVATQIQPREAVSPASITKVIVQQSERESAGRGTEKHATAAASTATADEVLSGTELLSRLKWGRETEFGSSSEAEPSVTDEHPTRTGSLDEETVAGQIIKLWNAERKVHGTTLRTRAELRSLREKLSEQLSYFKTALVATGRAGRWHAFLRQAKIPRTTADRLVKKHEKALHPQPEKCTTGSVPSTPQRVAELVKRLIPRLRRELSVAESVRIFLHELSSALEKDSPAL